MTLALLAVRIVLGILLGWAGVAKALDPMAFQQAIAGFDLLPIPVSAVVALYLPWLEIVLAIVLCMGSWGWRSALALTWSLVAVFTVALVTAWARGLDPDCGCFGTGSSGPLWGILRNSVLLLAATALWYAHERRGRVVMAVDVRCGTWQVRPAAMAMLVILAMGVAIGIRGSPLVASNDARTQALAVADPPFPTAPEPRTDVRQPSVTPPAPTSTRELKHPWSMWSIEQRQQTLTDWLLRPSLDANELDLLVSIVTDRTQSELTRNLAVDVLVAQERLVPGLAQALMRAAEDPTESLKWRDYAVQQVAQVARREVGIEVPVQFLRRIASDRRSPHAGTALLAQQQLAMAHRVTLDRAFDDAVLELAMDTGAVDAARITALTLAGERQIGAVLPLARMVSATPESSVALRRAALRAVGALGDASDDAIFQDGLASSHPLVVAAARAGYEHMLARMRLAHQPSNPVHSTR